MEIVPDPPKRLANLDKHGLDMASLTLEFFEAAVVVPAKRDRWLAIGMFAGRPVAVVFRPLGSQAIAPISMRPASSKERKLLK